MSRARRWKVVAILLLVGAIVSLAGLRLSMEKGKVWRLGWRPPWPIRRATPVTEVATHKLRRTLVIQGYVWNDWRQVVYCPVGGPIKISKIVPEGANVKKGDFVCRLDSSGLEARLGNLTSVARKAEVGYHDIKLAREAAEVALATLREAKTPALDKTILELNLDLQRKKSDEISRLAAWELARSQVQECRDQLASCTIQSPGDGPVAHAIDPLSFPRRVGLKEGATVRARQEILSVTDVNGAIRVSTKVPEKMIGRVNKGLLARVTFDESPELTLSGVVAEVAPLPDPSVAGVLIAQYTVRVQIEKGFPGIRPSMVAKVEILLEGLDDVLSVPAQAVLHSDGQDWVAVKNADDSFAWREVTVGVPSEAFVEVIHGLENGDLVALDPIALADGERPSRIRNSARTNPQKRPSRKVL